MESFFATQFGLNIFLKRSAYFSVTRGEGQTSYFFSIDVIPKKFGLDGPIRKGANFFFFLGDMTAIGAVAGRRINPLFSKKYFDSKTVKDVEGGIFSLVSDDSWRAFARSKSSDLIDWDGQTIDKNPYKNFNTKIQESQFFIPPCSPTLPPTCSEHFKGYFIKKAWKFVFLLYSIKYFSRNQNFLFFSPFFISSLLR